MAKRKRRKSKSGNSRTLLLLGCFALIALGIILMMRQSPESTATTPGIAANTPVEEYNSSDNIGNSDKTSNAGNTDKAILSKGHAVGSKHYPGLEYVELPEKLTSQVKEYAGFTISFNKDNRTPNYVAWELLNEETNGEKGRSNNFWSDPDIEGCPTTADYSRSGYDRGHMCPSGEQKWSHEAMNDCFVMANMCPQVHDLNNGAWKTLETKERQWAARDSALVIVAGPIYEKTDKERIGKAGVRVPSAFFKVLLAPYVDEPRGIAFVYPNMKAPGNMNEYAMSIDQLEKILGYDFFPALPDEIENKVESTYSFKEWNSSKR